MRPLHKVDTESKSLNYFQSRLYFSINFNPRDPCNLRQGYVQ